MTAKPPAPAPDPRAQIDKFRALARELQTDEDEARFDEMVKKLAKAPKAKAAPTKDD